MAEASPGTLLTPCLMFLESFLDRLALLRPPGIHRETGVPGQLAVEHVLSDTPGVQRRLSAAPGYELQYPGSVRSATAAWPGGRELFEVLGWMFGVAFAVELLLKIVTERRDFLCDCWNLFDALLVGAWLVKVIGSEFIPLDPTLLRLARLARLFRLIRILKQVEYMDSLVLIGESILGAASVLGWSILILFIVQTIMALALQQLLESWILDESNPLEHRMEVYQYYGSYSRGMLTQFELTMGNWIVPCRVLTEHVNEWFAAFMLWHQFFIGFAVVKVIMGVFLQVTFRTANNNDTIMISRKVRASKMHVTKMKRLFAHLDDSCDGTVDQEEFRRCAQEKDLKNWLSAMGLEMKDVDSLFRLVDLDGNGSVTVDELISGCADLKGTAKSFDLAVLTRNHRRLQQLARALESKLGGDTVAQAADRPPDGATLGSSAGASSGEGAACSDTIGEPRSSLQTAATCEATAAAEGSADAPPASDKGNARAETRWASTRHRVTEAVNCMQGLTTGEGEVERRTKLEFTRANKEAGFELTFAVAILLNTLVMALEAQYHSFDLAHALAYAPDVQPAAEVWPHGETAFVVFDWIFGIAFCIELVLKLSLMWKAFFRDPWSLFDTVLVLLWLWEVCDFTPLPLDAAQMRLARLFRLLRVVKLVRTIQGFESLVLLMTSIRASIGALFWSTTFLMVLQLLIALLINQLLTDYITDEREPKASRDEVYRMYGTTSRAMLTMFEISLANWIPSQRILFENVGEWYVVYALGHKCVIGFAVIMVITGVFIQETVLVANSNDQLMLTEKETAIKCHMEKMRALFSYADSSGDGCISREEWREKGREKGVMLWLSAMGWSWVRMGVYLWGG